jgi:hypothetical protein
MLMLPEKSESRLSVKSRWPAFISFLDENTPCAESCFMPAPVNALASPGVFSPYLATRGNWIIYKDGTLAPGALPASLSLFRRPSSCSTNAHSWKAVTITDNYSKEALT